MKPAATSTDNGAFSVPNSIFGPECISRKYYFATCQVPASPVTTSITVPVILEEDDS